jgi:Xaa-Pro aminopeptidase
MQRREVLGAGLIGATAGLLSGGAQAAQPGPPGAKTLKLDRPKRPLLIDRARAERFMREAGLDGMVVRDPWNVYYASNQWSVYTDYGSLQPNYAIIPRDPHKPVIAVATWVQLWKIAEGDADYTPAIIYDMRASKPGFTTFTADPVQAESLGPVEKTLLETSRSHVADAVRTPMEGVAKALRESGLAHGRVGVDDARIIYDFGQSGLAGPTLVEAVPVMYRIRLVKSAVEIGYLRQAAQVSADAAVAAIQRLDAGATLEDLRFMFREEAARRGAGYINIAADGPNFANHVVERGRPFMIDGVATVERYCGDFGRTAVLGEPTAAVSRACNRAKVAWEATYSRMKPGMRFSEVKAIGLDAALKAGFEVDHLGIGAHTVGLQHSEQPPTGGVYEDIVMEPGMVVSVDHPYSRWGWGTTHLEDLSVITETGVEPLNIHTDPIIVI